MSQPFMYAIAIMYLGASICFALEDKVAWCFIALCWGIGNALLGTISR